MQEPTDSFEDQNSEMSSSGSSQEDIYKRCDYNGELEGFYGDEELPFRTFDLYRRIAGDCKDRVFGRVWLCLMIEDKHDYKQKDNAGHVQDLIDNEYHRVKKITERWKHLQKHWCLLWRYHRRPLHYSISNRWIILVTFLLR